MDFNFEALADCEILCMLIYVFLSFQVQDPKPDTYYVYNHIRLEIQYHPKDGDWGGTLPSSAGRLVGAIAYPER